MDLDKVKQLLNELQDECDSVEMCHQCPMFRVCDVVLGEKALSQVCIRLLIGIDHEESRRL